MTIRRPLQILGDVVLIPLTKGLMARVDLADLHLVEGRNWCAASGYAVTVVKGEDRNRNVSLHRWIMGQPQGVEVDHIDGDRLNCRRANLRICTHRENMANQRPPRGKSSRFKGVSRAGPNHWQASIRIDGRTMALGWHRSEVDAARAYDAAALQAFGRFACTNDNLGLLTAARDAA